MGNINRFATAFTGLDDTPANFAGSANEFVRVNATPDALEFFDLFGSANTWTAVQTHSADVVPGSDNGNFELGDSAANTRWRRVIAQSGVFVGGDYNLSVNGSASTNGAVSVIGGNQTTKGGTSEIVVDHNSSVFTPMLVLANTYDYGAGHVARVTADSAGGGVVVGSVFTYGGGTPSATITATGFGSFTGGYSYAPGGTTAITNNAPGAFIWAYPQAGGGTVTVQATAQAAGAFVQGRQTSTSGGTLNFRAQQGGQFVQGFAQHAGTGTSSNFQGASGQSQGQFIQGALFQTSTGNASIEGGSGGRGAFVQGYVTNNGANTGLLTSTDDGSFAQGAVVAQSASATLRSSGTGAFAQGRVTNGTLEATNSGAFAQGFVNGTGDITTTGQGALARGAVTTGTITATNTGGLAAGNGAAGTISSSGIGAFAMGNAQSTNSITSTMNGAFSMGDAAGGDITGSGLGAMAFGCAELANIVASGQGALAFGNADDAAIEATATNAFQFGPGTNNIQDSFQFGLERHHR